MNVSDFGLQFIAGWEGLRNALYDDGGRGNGNCTIGVGHLVHLGPCDGRAEEAPYLNGLTDDECYALMRTDAQRFVDAVNADVHVRLTQNQFDALVDFAFNNGVGALAGIAAAINGGNDPCPVMKQYVHAGGVVLDALVRRRQAECDLYMKEDEMTPEQLDRLANVERQVASARLDLNALANGQDEVIKHNDVEKSPSPLTLKGLWWIAGKAWPF